ncbi:hypothetical protein PINS_up004682 [Pythium insidiosum]|nr:hypothetical protein PINS_up004682 [Pythium insidiosum]
MSVSARVSLPLFNSLDGTPITLSGKQMRQVFEFADQLLKDMAADYVTDVIVRSPMLIMSLNVLGNPA